MMDPAMVLTDSDGCLRTRAMASPNEPSALLQYIKRCQLTKDSEIVARGKADYFSNRGAYQNPYPQASEEFNHYERDGCSP